MFISLLSANIWTNKNAEKSRILFRGERKTDKIGRQTYTGYIHPNCKMVNYFSISFQPALFWQCSRPVIVYSVW